MKPIWIVDDDQSIRFVLQKALERAGLPVRSFASARDVQQALATEQPQVLVSDIRMPGGSGITLLQELKRSQPQLPVIIMTAYSDLDSAVSAFQSGAFEYLSKPFDVDKAVDLIRRAVDESLREQGVASGGLDTPERLGQAPAMQDVFRAIGRLSPSLVTVLITGESGTGKELVAQALHRHSPRAQGPFVAINTAAIPRDLLESELFGHERGAFTGAQTARRGRFEQAEGGTLFLDEIGDMPYELQTRLLRVLSDGQFYRVGGHAPIRANVRVIAATHQNLEQRVRDGLFREDLYHRLNVIRLRLPALRERREDIDLLVRHFLHKSAAELGVETKRVSEPALAVLQERCFERVGGSEMLPAAARIVAATHRDLERQIELGRFREDLYYRLHVVPIQIPALRERGDDIVLLAEHALRGLEAAGLGRVRLGDGVAAALLAYAWPGNVRELQNLMERLVIMHAGGTVQLRDLPAKMRDEQALPPSLPDAGAAEPDDADGGVRELMQLVAEPGDPVLPARGIDLRAYLERIERSLIEQALRASDHVIAHAAARLGLRRTTLVEKIRKYNLRDGVEGPAASADARGG